jgi:hypothetical protein
MVIPPLSKHMRQNNFQMNSTHTWIVHLQAHCGLTIAAIHPVLISNRLSLGDVITQQSKVLSRQPTDIEIDALNQCRFLDAAQMGEAKHSKRIWQLQNLNRSLSCSCNNALLAYGDTIALTESEECFDLEFGLFHFVITYRAWADLPLAHPIGVTNIATGPSPSDAQNNFTPPAPNAFSLTDLAHLNHYDSLDQGLIFDIKDGAFNDAIPPPTVPTHVSQTQAVARPLNTTPHSSAAPIELLSQAPRTDNDKPTHESELEQLLTRTEQPKELVQLHTDYIAVIKDPTLLLNAYAWQSHSVNRLGTSDEFSALMERAKIYPHIHEVIQPDKNLMAVVDSLDSLTDSNILDPEKKVDILMLFAPEDLKNIPPPLINRLTGFTAQEHHITSLDSVF